jgi:hypothetical protein
LPKQAHSSLKWSKLGAYSLKSECGRFTVGKSVVDGKTWYGAWLGKTMLGVRLESGDAAKQLCESYALELDKAPVQNSVPAALQIKSKAEMACK